MDFDLEIFKDEKLSAYYIDFLTDEQSPDIQEHFSRLWDYYSNQMKWFINDNDNEQSRKYLQSQEVGLPTRITGINLNGKSVSDIKRKEVVIENDISWRINAAVDFLFGKPIKIVSVAPAVDKRNEIEKIIKAVFDANGAIGFFQNMGLIGSVYGFVDCVVRPALHKHNSKLTLEQVIKEAEKIDLELIDSSRALPILDENDYRKIVYYIQHFLQKRNEVQQKNFIGFGRLLSRKKDSTSREVIEVTEIISAKAWQRYEGGNLVKQGELPWGFLPVVHIQNIALPFYYEGLSDVEPLIPLQDELNTRLSDRANRITFQSFKMYLGKGIDGFEDKPISPGRMWQTDNTDATIEEFGGDAANPSEDAHILEIRGGIDKISSVSPIMTGNLKTAIGNLTSAVAIKLTFMGMLLKNNRKQFTYSNGIEKICEMVLSMLDTYDIYKTDEGDRKVQVVFPNPLPEDITENLNQATMKKNLGVAQETILKELGY